MDHQSVSEIDVPADTSVGTAGGKRLPGEPGLWVFLFGDMVIFGIFFVTFLVERAKEPEIFQSSRDGLDLTIGLTNTMILLTSSLFVVIGLESVRRVQFPVATKMFAAAMGCGVLFAILKAVEYTHMVTAGEGPGDNAYYMWFFILTGTHLFHVLIGLVVLFVLLKKTRNRAQAAGSNRAIYEGGACYWHLVDLLWMVLFPLVYLAA